MATYKSNNPNKRTLIDINPVSDSDPGVPSWPRFIVIHPAGRDDAALTKLSPFAIAKGLQVNPRI